MMSSNLEEAWGVFKFNLFLLLGILASIVGAFVGQVISPGALVFVSPYFLYLSVFFAFAMLNPNIQFLILFVVPVKVKWLAWFAAAITAVSILGAASFGEKLALLAPLFNYFLYFRSALALSIENRNRRAKFGKTKKAAASEALHTCASCGATDRTHPDLDFRYKSIDGKTVCVCGTCREQA